MTMAEFRAPFDGPKYIAQCSRLVPHTISDDPADIVDGYALLSVEGDEVADIKVMLWDGTVDTITGVSADYLNSRNFLVKKIYSTGTTFTTSKLKLYQ